MMNEANEPEQVLRLKVKDVLLNEWDPIGVRTAPEAQDEYDAYVPAVLSMVFAGKPVDDVFDYLAWVEAEYMGLALDVKRAKLTAERLTQLRSTGGPRQPGK